MWVENYHEIVSNYQKLFCKLYLNLHFDNREYLFKSLLKFHLVMNLILRETNNFIRLLSRDDSFFSITFMLYFFVSVFISIYIRHMPSYISYPVPLTFHFSKPKEKERGGDWILFQSNLSAMHARILYPQSWNPLPVCLCLGSVLHFTNCTKLFFFFLSSEAR